MTQQPVSSTPSSDTPSTPGATETDDINRLDPDALTDEQAVDLMRRWAESAQKDPSAHTSFTNVARIFVDTLADEVRRAKRTAARGTGRLKSYELQPVGVPAPASVTLDGDDIYDIFESLLAAVQAWRHSDDVIEDYNATVHLLGLTNALALMTHARITATAPLTNAHRDDDRAAEEWKSARWMARTQPARTPAGSIVASERGES